MTSRRLRFEVLRRDGYACRYCGAAAPEATLTIDHVLPTTLGGTDTADNLVTACTPCNIGKSSIAPDQPMVEKISDDALRWAAAVKEAAAASLMAHEEATAYADAVLDEWFKHTWGWQRLPAPVPEDARPGLDGFRVRGLPIEILTHAATIALTNDKVAAGGKWRYFMGIAWNKLREIEADAKLRYDGDE
jgi:hypothetical protein